MHEADRHMVAATFDTCDVTAHRTKNLNTKQPKEYDLISTSFQTRQSDLRLPNYPDIRPAGANPGSASISAPPDSKYRMLRPKYGTLHTASFVVYHFFAGSINCFNVMLSVRMPSCHHFRYRNSSNLEGPVATALLAEAV
jgi:hypothetical protein